MRERKVDARGAVYDARENGYAVGAINHHNEETAQAILLGAKDADAPVFAQIGRAIKSEHVVHEAPSMDVTTPPLITTVVVKPMLPTPDVMALTLVRVGVMLVGCWTVTVQVPLGRLLKL